MQSFPHFKSAQNPPRHVPWARQAHSPSPYLRKGAIRLRNFSPLSPIGDPPSLEELSIRHGEYLQSVHLWKIEAQKEHEKKGNDGVLDFRMEPLPSRRVAPAASCVHTRGDGMHGDGFLVYDLANCVHPSSYIYTPSFSLVTDASARGINPPFSRVCISIYNFGLARCQSIISYHKSSRARSYLIEKLQGTCTVSDDYSQKQAMH